MVAQRRSSLFDSVDPALAALIEGFRYNGPYGVRPTSGYRPGDPRQHGLGNAMDVQLYDPETNASLANYQDPTTFSAYQNYANALYRYALQTDPALAQKLRWGGYFSGGKGKYGALDLMHFDTAGDIGMAGGSWEGGLTPEQAKIWGLQPGGGVGGAGGAQQGPPANTQVVNYSPEQRRNAIASIESAGSGDYKALGGIIGRSGDRAYGRYQIMGSNIPQWSKEVLGREVSVDEFLNDPKIQDAIFDKKFGDYVQKYGEENAARAWFGGEGNINKTGVKDPNGLNIGDYGQKYLAALGAAKGDATTPGAATYQPGGSLAPATATQTAAAGPEKVSPLADLTSNIGGLAGTKAPAGLPISTVPKIPVGRTMGVSSPVADTSSQDQLRAQLAQRMAQLNAGKLWM
jgi:hypothetical protein